METLDHLLTRAAAAQTRTQLRLLRGQYEKQLQLQKVSPIYYEAAMQVWADNTPQPSTLKP